MKLQYSCLSLWYIIVETLLNLWWVHLVLNELLSNRLYIWKENISMKAFWIGFYFLYWLKNLALVFFPPKCLNFLLKFLTLSYKAVGVFKTWLIFFFVMKWYEYLIIFFPLDTEFLTGKMFFFPCGICLYQQKFLFKAKFIRLNRSFHHWLGYSLTEVTLELFSYVKTRFTAQV